MGKPEYDEGVFEVEAILDHRRIRYRKYEFRVLWKGYGEDETTWQSPMDLRGSRQLLAEYKAKHPDVFRGPKAKPPSPCKKLPRGKKRKVGYEDEDEIAVRKITSHRVHEGQMLYAVVYDDGEERELTEEDLSDAPSYVLERYKETLIPASAKKNDTPPTSSTDATPKVAFGASTSKLPATLLDLFVAQTKPDEPPGRPFTFPPVRVNNEELGSTEPYSFGKPRLFPRIRAPLPVKESDLGKNSGSKEASPSKALPGKSGGWALEPKKAVPPPPKMARINNSAEVNQDKAKFKRQYGIVAGLRVKSFDGWALVKGQLFVRVTYYSPIPAGVMEREIVPVDLVRHSMNHLALSEFLERKLVELGTRTNPSPTPDTVFHY